MMRVPASEDHVRAGTGIVINRGGVPGPLPRHAAKGLLVACLAVSVCGLANAQTPDAAFGSDALSFLVVGATTREVVFAKLGEPSARYTADGILTYRLRADTGYRSVPRAFDWYPATHSLVLRFDQRDVLVQKALVRVR
jgi:hypothetical protein